MDKEENSKHNVLLCLFNVAGVWKILEFLVSFFLAVSLLLFISSPFLAAAQGLEEWDSAP